MRPDSAIGWATLADSIVEGLILRFQLVVALQLAVTKARGFARGAVPVAAAVALGLGAAAAVFSPEQARAQTHESVASRSSPIINGRLAAPGEQLGTIAVLDATSAEFFCSGTLVTPGVVVTAAHCLFTQDGIRLRARDLLVAFGTRDVTSPPSPEHLVTVTHSAAHPDYVSNPTGDELPSGLDPSEHDIAVLVLDRDVVEQFPVPMATGAEARDALGIGNVVTLTGFGVTDTEQDPGGILRVVDATILDAIDREFLAGAANTTQGDSCFGDSGGPAYGFVAGEPILLGVTSRGRADVDTLCGDGGIWTSADAYRRWVMTESHDTRVAPDLLDHGRCSVSHPRPPLPAEHPLAGILASIGTTAALALAHTRARRRETRARHAHEAHG